MTENTPKIIDAEFTEIISDKVDSIVDKILEEGQTAAVSQSPVEDLEKAISADATTAVAYLPSESIQEVKINRRERRAQEAWDRRTPSRLLNQKKQAVIRNRREDVAARVKRDVEASRARRIARNEVKPTE